MLRRLLPLVLLAAPAAAQLDCDDVEPLPLDVFVGAVPGTVPFDVGRAVLDGDLAVLSSPDEPAGAAGERGALYVHRRTGSGWVVEQRLDLFDAGATPTGATDFADRWDAHGEWLFARFRDGSLAGSPHRIAVFQRGAGGWSNVQTLDADPTFFETGTFGSLVAFDGARLVVGSFDARAFQGVGRGTLESFTLSPGGAWERADLTTGQNFDIEEAHRVAMDGDRLAGLTGDELRVVERIPTGWRTEHVLDVTLLPTSSGAQAAASVALAGERVVVGGVVDAAAYVLDLDAGSSMPVLQTIAVDDFPARSTGTPRSALVAAAGDFLVVATGDDDPGQPTIRLFEWDEGTYRTFDVLRAGAGSSAVALDAGRALLAAPWLSAPMGSMADARLEVRRVDGARAVPLCLDVGTLLVGGSGAAPFDAATIRGYDLPPGAVALVLGGPVAGSATFGGAPLCIDATQGLARVGGPVTAGSIGSFVVPTASIDLSPLAGWLVAGATFHLQAVYRDGSGVRATNALRVTLCD